MSPDDASTPRRDAEPTPWPTGAEVIAENRSGLIGKPVDRVDGLAKVTGAARYSYEVMGAGEAAYGVLVGATIAKGRIVRIDAAAAERAPGVVLVWTHTNVPPQGERHPEGAMRGGARPALSADRVDFYGEPVALVVAETLEAARAGAALTRIDYATEPAEVVFGADLDAALRPAESDDSAVGDFEAAFAAAPVQIDAVYTTPVQNHCQMEPHATTAVWEGDRLTVHTSTQMLKQTQATLAETIGHDRKKVRVISRYIGGGFGGKFLLHADAVLAALAARELGRPVKVAFQRQQMFHGTVHRPASIQRVRLGAERDGRLTAIGHEGWVHCARREVFTEHVANFTRSLYAAPNRMTRQRLSKLDLPVAGAMRAPGEAIGMLSVECAMDELACALGVDPVELRIRNEPSVDPETGKPFSSRNLVACLREGARRFGWSERRPAPCGRREGRMLIGMGVSAAIRSNYLTPAKAAMRIDAQGRASVLQAMTDIGTGSYTVLAQIAAETLGLAIDQVRVEIGDSALPPTMGSGGSFGAASAGSAVLDAGMNLRRALAELAVGDPASPLHGADPARARFSGGTVGIENRSETLAALVARAAPQGVEAEGEIKVPETYNDYSQHAFGAYFAETSTDVDTGETRLRRMLGVFAAGRILNDKTARSQAIGGMIWGVGGVLTEENAVDARYGGFVNQDLATYHVPAHADIAGMEAVYLPEDDDKGNPLGIKGVGELGICGAGAAVANAVFNATGVRVRDYPITLDKLLAGLTPKPS